jgi:hypothetical protein
VSISDDPRTVVVKAGFALLLSDPSAFRVGDGVERRAEELAGEIALSGPEAMTRRVRQFVALAFCLAASKSYVRGEKRVEVEDVQEAHELLKPWL